MDNLFNLTKQYEDIYLKLLDSVDAETGEVDEELNKALEIKTGEVEVKAESVACIIKKFEYLESAVDEELKRLKALKEHYANKQAFLKNSLASSLLKLGKSRIDGVKATISFRESTQTIIEDLEALPEEFKKAKITFEADKTRIKQAIERGFEVKGARLEKKKNLQVK